jgi:transposase-like protein
MLGYLASGCSCPKCDATMSTVLGKPDSSYCASCGETFHLQLGHLLSTRVAVTHIDLTVSSIDITDVHLRGPIETPT